jgi:biotin operon repressor
VYEKKCRQGLEPEAAFCFFPSIAKSKGKIMRPPYLRPIDQNINSPAPLHAGPQADGRPGEQAAMTPKEAAYAKFELLERMACDKRLTASSFQVGILLLKRFNSALGYAWPSQARLAEETGLNRTTVTRAWQQLQTYGYFEVQECKGRGHTNHYVPEFAGCSEIDEAVHTDLGDGLHTKGCMPANKRMNAFDKTPSMNPFKDSVGRRARARDRPTEVYITKNRGKDGATLLPGDWKPGKREIAYAENAGFRGRKLVREIEKFKDHWAAAEHGRKRDWCAMFRTWIRRAAEAEPEYKARLKRDREIDALVNG